MYITKPQDITYDNTTNDSLVNVINEQLVIIKQDSATIDSLDTLVLKEREWRLLIQQDLIKTKQKYESQISSIDSNNVSDDINFFYSKYISETASN